MKETVHHSYKDTFTPTRSPTDTPKVQTVITDCIKDATPEWYAEVDRIATMVDERAMSTMKKRDHTKCQNTHVNLQWQLTPGVHKNRDIPTNLRKLIKNRGKIISVLADGTACSKQ